MPSLVFCTGFEFGMNTPASWIKGNAGAKIWDANNGTPAITAVAAPHSGTYSMVANVSTAVGGLQLTTGTLGTSKTALVTSFWIRFPSALPSTDMVLCIIQEAAFAGECEVWYRTATTNITANFGSGGTALASEAITFDTWYLIDLRFDVHTNPHTIDMTVNGTSTGAQLTHAVVAGTILNCNFGPFIANATGTLWLDDIVVSTTGTDYPLGGHKVVLLIPDTGGTATEIGAANATSTFTSNGTAGTTFDSASLLSYTSEVPPTISASANGFIQRTAASGNAAEIPMTTYTLSAGETVSGLRLLVCGWAGTTTANNISFRTYNGTTERTLFATADPNFDNSTTAAGWICEMATPADFDTQTELDAFAVRAGYSTDVSPVPGAHAFYGELAVLLATTLDASVTAAVIGATAALPGVTIPGDVFPPALRKTYRQPVQRATVW